MKTICIIGLGTISRNHHFGLTNNGYFKLVGACDTDDDAIGRSIYANYPFYRDHRRMIAELRPDFVVVTTPPATHAAIAVEALGMGCSVIIEKPTAASTGEIMRVRDTAVEKGLYFETAYHWQYGGEVLAVGEILGRYGGIKHIHVGIQDPYSADGVSIDGEKLGLNGTFLDSGSNAVSLLYRLADFERFELSKAEYINAANADLPIYSRHLFRCGETTAEVEVDWRRQINKKATSIVFRDDNVMRIEHSGQSIYYQDELIWCDRRIADRLTAHYYNYYNCFSPSSARSAELLGVSIRISEIWEGRSNGR